jgi:hypothetical protein
MPWRSAPFTPGYCGYSALPISGEIRDQEQQVIKTVTLMTDDLTGEASHKPARTIQTVAFALDGAELEIDLTDKHAAELRAAFAPYLACARKVTRRTNGHARVTPRRHSRGGPDTGAIRDWAKAQGLELKERGRVPAEIEARYQAAHP